jgi:predicted acyltransferase
MVSLNPYAGALGGRDPVAVMAETPRRLEVLVGGVSAAQIEARPGPGKWSVREILAHLADCEIAFGFRLRQVCAGAPVMQPFDQDDWARAYPNYSAGLALATFVALRDWNLAFIAGLSETDKQRAGMHPERGEMVLWTIVETMAGHDLHHLKALDAGVS